MRIASAPITRPRDSVLARSREACARIRAIPCDTYHRPTPNSSDHRDDRRQCEPGDAVLAEPQHDDGRDSGPIDEPTLPPI